MHGTMTSVQDIQAPATQTKAHVAHCFPGLVFGFISHPTIVKIVVLATDGDSEIGNR